MGCKLRHPPLTGPPAFPTSNAATYSVTPLAIIGSTNTTQLAEEITYLLGVGTLNSEQVRGNGVP